MLGILGLLAALSVLIIMALRGHNIIFSSLVAALLIASTNQIGLSDALNKGYLFGPLGAFSFAGKFFLLFVAGAVFGKMMSISRYADSIAYSLSSALGAQKALWIAVLFCALLTYTGVVVFVVIFTAYPLGIKLLEMAKIPKRLLCAAIALGAGTFTMTALPGTPSIHNVIAASALNTDLFAGASIGIIASLAMFALGMWYLEHQRLHAQLSSSVEKPGVKDKSLSDELAKLPSWHKALTPLSFAQSQAIIWPSLALFIASGLILLLEAKQIPSAIKQLGDGCNDALLPLMNTAAVIGFGGVVSLTNSFQLFSQAIINSSLPPLVSLFGSINLASGLVGSSSGGLQIFMKTLAPSYLEMGIAPEVLHRIAAIASGCFDSLPHSGAVIALLTIMGLSHKEAYKDIAVVTVVIPSLVCAALVAGLVFTA